VAAAGALEPCLPYALPATCHSWQVSASSPCHGVQLTAAEGAAWAAVLPLLAGHELTLGLGLTALEVAVAEGALTASSAEAEAGVEALQQCHLSLQATEAAALSLHLLPLQVVAEAVVVPSLQTLAAAAEGQVPLRLTLPEVAEARAPYPPTGGKGVVAAAPRLSRCSLVLCQQFHWSAALALMATRASTRWHCEP